MEKINLQLILSERAQELLDHFARIMELRYTFIDLQGNMISRGLQMRNCDYCRLLQEEFGKMPQCLATDQSNDVYKFEIWKLQSQIHSQIV